MSIPPPTLPFDQTKLRRIYIEELYWLASQLVKHADALFAAHPVDATSAYIKAMPDDLDLIYSVLSSAAKIQELLYPQRRRPVGLARSAHLQALLGTVSLTETGNKKVRNTVEHFGEYLDEQNLRHSGITSSVRYAVMANMIVSHWDPVAVHGLPFRLYKTPQLPLPLYPVRVYVASERRFYNMEWSVDLEALRSESTQMMAALRPSFKEADPAEWISSLAVL